MSQPQPLSDHERALLIRIRDGGSPPEARRAQIILMSDESASVDQIAQTVSLTVRQVYYWRREWGARRLGIFPTLPEDLAPGVEDRRLPLELRPAIGITPDDPAAEAGRKVLHFHFERMLLHESGARLGEDIEYVHDMRTATRRMRSALRLFSPFFDPDAIRPYRRGLRRLADSLGAVRDLDVLMVKARHFCLISPEFDLAPLFDAWGQQLAESRQGFIDHLDSPQFGRFAGRFHAFLITPGLGVLPPPSEVTACQVRHVAPRLIGEQYEQVRSYEPILSAAEARTVPTLHALRIDFKRLRYALEFFSEVLGPEAKTIGDEAKAMQDYLGSLQDAHVAGLLLQAFIDHHETSYSGVPRFMRPDISGVRAYAAAKEAEKHDLLRRFPLQWERFLRESVRRDLALAIAEL